MTRTPQDAAPTATSFLRPGIGQILGRSLLPLVACALLLGTLLWGPWITLALTFAWWRVVGRIG